jgi:uncharacterized protein YqgQ
MRTVAFNVDHSLYDPAQLLKTHLYILYIYLLLTAIGLMPGGSVYKDHTFNKETAHTSHENSTIKSHEFPQYNISVHEHP